jgi:hypothetical protein
MNDVECVHETQTLKDVDYLRVALFRTAPKAVVTTHQKRSLPIRTVPQERSHRSA